MFDTSIAADVPWDVTPEQAQSMTAEQATAALAVRHAALHPPPSVVPMDAQDARALIEIRSRDASFANALLSGSVAARKEWDELNAKADGGDDVADAIANIQERAPLFETTNSQSGQLNRRDHATFVSADRNAGLSDAVIEQRLNSPPIPRAEHALATAAWNMRSGNAEWAKRLLAGNSQARWEWENLTTLLSSPIKE